MAKKRTNTHTKKKQDKSQINKQIMLVVVVGILSAGIFIGFGNSKTNADDNELASSLNLPGYAYSSPITLKAYEYTALNPQIIDQVPCYCGCGGLGHESLLNCFMTDDGEYDNHASQCDICVGEVIKIKKMYEDGLSIDVIRANIDNDYRKYADPTGYRDGSSVTPASAVDLSGLSLTEEFDSLSDGLKMTPYGLNWARFININGIAGTPLESYASEMVQPTGFYGTPVVGMLSADYSATSWIELHDIGRTDVTVQPNNGNGMTNIVTGRPFIYGHSGNVARTAELLGSGDVEQSSYPIYQSVLVAVNDESYNFASVTTEIIAFSDVKYTGLKPLDNGKIEKVVAYHITDEVSIPRSIYDAQKTSVARGFDSYEVTLDNDVLIIKMVSDLSTALNENV
ncbi:MAG: PCYCGC motif-containing (lipo)protein [Methanosarcinaceae archaeon]|nr:PCYCGC motif-containing (lipo)protein [Methanosarcinaceae archaeon]